MIETILLVGRVLLIALLFLFLFTVMRTGIGQVRGQTRGHHWTISLIKGPRELSSLKLAVTSSLVLGRAAGADILINAEYVSGRHARFTPLDSRLILEDLGSTNGTQVNGLTINTAVDLAEGDAIQVGEVVLQVTYL